MREADPLVLELDHVGRERRRQSFGRLLNTCPPDQIHRRVCKGGRDQERLAGGLGGGRDPLRDQRREAPRKWSAGFEVDRSSDDRPAELEGVERIPT